MNDFHYNFIKKNFDAEFLFTDTDSLTYEIFFIYIYIYNYGSTQTFTKQKIYNHQTPKHFKGIWE